MNRSTFILLGILLLLLALPIGLVNRLRSSAVGAISFSSGPQSCEVERLKLENAGLRRQLDYLAAFDAYEEELLSQIASLKGFAEADDLDGYVQRRSKELARLLKGQLQAMPARVTYRNPTNWNNFLWVDVGSNHECVSEDSPVVVGNAVVGVVDYVGKKRSRVRLLTDQALVPSVRTVRGTEQNRQLLGHITAIQETLFSRGDLFTSDEATQILNDNLQILKGRLDESGRGLYLAKGELHGAIATNLLQGVGFNYDFADAEGPARDIRSTPALVEQGDLLVTTGMDGIFPAGLEVGYVTEVEPLSDGEYTYTLKARPAAGSFSDLTTLFILPPTV